MIAGPSRGICHDPKEQVVTYVTAHEHNGHLYLGSFRAPYLCRLTCGLLRPAVTLCPLSPGTRLLPGAFVTPCATPGSPDARWSWRAWCSPRTPHLG